MIGVWSPRLHTPGMSSESISPMERFKGAAPDSASAIRSTIVVGTAVVASLVQAAVTDSVSAQEAPKRGSVPTKQEKKEEKEPVVETVDHATTYLINALAGRHDMEKAWKHLERFEPESAGAVFQYLRNYDPGPVRAVICHKWLARRAEENPKMAAAILKLASSGHDFHAETVLRAGGPRVVEMLLQAVVSGDERKTAKNVLSSIGGREEHRAAVSKRLGATLADPAQKVSGDCSRSSAYILFSTHQWDALATACQSANAVVVDDVAFAIEFALKEAGGEFYVADPKKAQKTREGVATVLSILNHRASAKSMESLWEAYRDSVAQWEKKYAPKKD